jgi:endoglucanase
MGLAVVAAGALVAGFAGTAAAVPTDSGNPLQPGAQFYVDQDSSTLDAAANLTGQDLYNALLMAQYPSATWFTGGTPDEVEADVAATVTAAKAADQVPVLVAYNLPNRDCGQYSAGGAQNLADYEAWIDGFAAGIGDAPAVVILEPDGLGIIPNYIDPDQTATSCPIDGANPDDRFAAVNHAVDALKAGAHTAVYLDGTNSNWMNVGDMAQRLIKAGVQRADGFFLNVSNYQFTQNQVYFGTWVSDCVALAEANSPDDPAAYDFADNCGNQYWNGGPASNWYGVAMSALQQWHSQPIADPNAMTTDETASMTWNTAAIDSRYAAAMGTDIVATTHFVVDTSRNGTGEWDYASAGYSQSAAQDWCNPPGAGIGLPPTTDTGNALVDAYLWVKVPGESDGQCDRGAGQGTDAMWGGIADPAAGAWFPAQAAQLIANANPALTKTVPTTSLTYDANAPTGATATVAGMPDLATVASVLVGTTIAVPAAPTLAGYTFGGWCTTDATPCDVANLYQPGDPLRVMASTTLYATWTRNPPVASAGPVTNTGGSVLASGGALGVTVLLALAGAGLLVRRRRVMSV